MAKTIGIGIQSFEKLIENHCFYAAAASLGTLSEYLCRYYGKPVIILLDEYDTPLQEAWVCI